MKNLFKMREQKKLNQLALSLKVGVAQEMISSYEVGKSKPSVKTLIKLCDELGVSSDYLLDRTNIPTPVNQLVIDNMSSDELEILSQYRKLSLKKKQRLLGYLSGLLDDLSDPS